MFDELTELTELSAWFFAFSPASGSQSSHFELNGGILFPPNNRIDCYDIALRLPSFAFEGIKPDVVILCQECKTLLHALFRL